MINQPPAARPVPRFALFAVDFAVTAVTLVAGPPLAVSMIKLPFGG